MRLERIILEFPDPAELVGLAELRYMSDKGFSLTEDARALLMESVEALSGSSYFKGFKTISHLGESIMYNILTTEMGEGRQITAAMLSGFGKDSYYVRRMMAGSDMKKVIGFAGRGVQQ
jgi:hypothetical protein